MIFLFLFCISRNIIFHIFISSTGHPLRSKPHRKTPLSQTPSLRPPRRIPCPGPPPPPDPPKFRFFFFTSSRLKFHSLCSLGVFSWNFGGGGPPECTFGLSGSSCETPGRRGFATELRFTFASELQLACISNKVFMFDQ